MNTNEWTDEMEAAKWRIIDNYFCKEIADESLRKHLGTLIFEGQLQIGNLVFHKAGEREAYWRCKDVNKY